MRVRHWRVVSGGDLQSPELRVVGPASPYPLPMSGRSLLCAFRYLAYSSDVGESFRPVANPLWVNASYGVAALYVIGDIAYNGYLAQQQGKNNTVR